MATSVLKISLSDDMVEEIQRYKESSHKQSIEETIIELINNALKLPHYFMKYDWNKAEIEANHEIFLGKTESFDTVDDFIADLKK
jgi:predicted CopG family antitoxin